MTLVPLTAKSSSVVTPKSDAGTSGVAMTTQGKTKAPRVHSILQQSTSTAVALANAPKQLKPVVATKPAATMRGAGKSLNPGVAPLAVATALAAAKLPTARKPMGPSQAPASSTMPSAQTATAAPATTAVPPAGRRAAKRSRQAAAAAVAAAASIDEDDELEVDEDAVRAEMEAWAAYNLSIPVLVALQQLKFSKPTPIQVR